MRLENTHGAYPLATLFVCARTPSVAGHPMDIIFCIYDAFGVLRSAGRVSLRDWVHCQGSWNSEPAAMSSLCPGSPFPVWHFLHPGD
jgi:hypothetical protein